VPRPAGRSGWSEKIVDHGASRPLRRPACPGRVERAQGRGECVAVSHLVSPNLLKAVGSGLIATRGSLLGELAVHRVDLVRLALNRISQVGRLASNDFG